MDNIYTIEALKERFGVDLLVIDPEQCKGLKAPYIFFNWEFNGFNMNIEGPVNIITKVIEAIDKECVN